MHPIAKTVAASEVLPLRTRHREEMNCQIVHDSIHRRQGWTLIYQLELQGTAVGYGTVAIGGPWKEKPTVLEYYVLPEHRGRAFELFEVFLATATPAFFEIQSNDVLPTVMLHTYGRDIVSEKIVFRDGFTTTHPSGGATMRLVTSDEEVRQSLERRQGSSDWILEMDGQPVGKGGLAFHYNRPYADVYMEVGEAFRRRGLGSYLVQELKRFCYELGAVPAARCNVGNVASRRTLQRGGLVPFAHILLGTVN